MHGNRQLEGLRAAGEDVDYVAESESPIQSAGRWRVDVDGLRARRQRGHRLQLLLQLVLTGKLVIVWSLL